LTDTYTYARHARQKRLMLTKPNNGWSREDYDRDLRAYIDERGRAPQTVTMHPETAATLGLDQTHGNDVAVLGCPLVVTSPEYAPELITLYF
jgi:hypothetical protein